MAKFPHGSLPNLGDAKCARFRRAVAIGMNLCEVRIVFCSDGVDIPDPLYLLEIPTLLLQVTTSHVREITWALRECVALRPFDLLSFLRGGPPNLAALKNIRGRVYPIS